MTQLPARPYTGARSSIADEVATLPSAARLAFTARLDTLVSTLTDGQSLDLADALDLVSDEVGHRPDLLWLAASVLGGGLPSDDDMSDLLLRARLSGTWAALATQVDALASATRLRDVEVIRGGVTCDVHTTASSQFLSGIQRVVYETVSRWNDRHDVTFVSWVDHYSALRRIRDDERQRLFGPGQVTVEDPRMKAVVVPWESTHLWVEVITNLGRTGRLLGMAQHSRNEVAVLGYDSIPITSSNTVAEGMTSHFARSLSAARRTDRVAMISEAAAEEFRGVMDMGAGRRDRGPEVAAVPLAVTSREVTDADLAEARRGLVIDGMPMVLVVGSHEPRKNHLAVLHAAELLWREGLRFSLVLVGAGSWNATEYDTLVGDVMRSGRPVQSIRGLPDRLLWAAYRLAHCTLFPSLNEGFGLPVAESLAVGTPVITSSFGSMRDIVAPDGDPAGALLVDPRDDSSIAGALRTMLGDPATYARLRSEAAERPERSWDDYADEAWSFLVEGVRPPE